MRSKRYGLEVITQLVERAGGQRRDPRGDGGAAGAGESLLTYITRTYHSEALIVRGTGYDLTWVGAMVSEMTRRSMMACSMRTAYQTSFAESTRAEIPTS